MPPGLRLDVFLAQAAAPAAGAADQQLGACRFANGAFGCGMTSPPDSHDREARYAEMQSLVLPLRYSRIRAPGIALWVEADRHLAVRGRYKRLAEGAWLSRR